MSLSQLTSFAFLSLDSSAALSPIIILPGLWGSRLRATVQDKPHPAASCPTSRPDSPLWAADDRFFLDFSCWADDMRLEFDEDELQFKAAKGVHVTVDPSLAGIEDISWNPLSRKLPGPFKFFKPLVDFMVEETAKETRCEERYSFLSPNNCTTRTSVRERETDGFLKIDLRRHSNSSIIFSESENPKQQYVREENIIAFPYDFRLGPHSDTDAPQKLLALTERLFKKFSNTPVTWVCLSLGCLWSHHVLAHIATKSWKSKFIHAMVNMSPAYSGTVLSILQLASGYNLGLPSPMPSPLQMRAVERSFESTFWMLPNLSLFGSHRPLLVTPTKSFSASQLPELLSHLGVFSGLSLEALRAFVKKTVPNDFPAPEVRVLTAFGSARMSTLSSLHYGRDEKTDGAPTYTGLSSGDGIVEETMLRAGNFWQYEQSEKVEEIGIFREVSLSGSLHAEVVSDKGVLERVLQVAREA